MARTGSLGWEALHNRDSIRERLGPPLATSPLSGSRNIVSEGAIYGEITQTVTRRLAITGGARVSFNVVSGEVLGLPVEAAEPKRKSLVFLPSFGALWKLSHDLSIYARYQEGFRPGGLSVANDQIERYRGDGLSTIELGARLGTASSRFQGSAALSLARWKNIQADLVQQNGFSYTTNVGDGRILGFEAQARWRPLRMLTLSGGLFLNDSTLDKPAAGFAGERDASLPNVEDLSFQGRADLELPIGKQRFGLHAALRYVGGSKLAVGSAFDYSQGHYVATSAGMSWPIRAWILTADIDNLLDDGRNQFALGNPFMLAAGHQMTPSRPRTIRLGLSTGF